MKSSTLLIFCVCILIVAPLAAQNAVNPDEQKCLDLSGDEAIAACTRAIDSHTLPTSNLANTYYNRGCEYRNKNQCDLAIADYNQAIQLDPTHVQSYNNRAVCLYNKGEYDSAAADYVKALQLDPKHVNSYYGLGNVYRLKGDYAKAIEYYGETLKLSPDLSGAIMNRGITYSEMGAYAMAITDYKDAVRAKSPNAFLPLLLAVAKMHTGDTNIAADMNDEVQGLSNSWPMPVMQFYLGKLSADGLTAAAKDNDATVQLSQMCDTYFYLGEWQIYHGQKAQGLENLRAAKSSCSQTNIHYILATNDLNLMR